MRAKEIIKEFKELQMQLPTKIKETGYKDLYIMDKIGLNRSNFYRRMKRPELFTMDEMERILDITESQKTHTQTKEKSNPPENQ